MEKALSERLELPLVMLITFSGGLQDAYSYFYRGGVFANAQTGNIVLLCANLVNGNFSGTIKYLVPLLFFILGVIVAKTLYFLFRQYKSASWKQVVLLLETATLVGACFISQEMNLYANALVSFSCAMQVLTFNKVLGNEFASTMCIGNMVKMSSSFVSAIVSKDKQTWKSVGVYLLIIVIFGIGAGLGYLIQNSLNRYAILISAALTLISSLLLLIGRMEERKKEISKEGMKYEENE